jgi:HD-GYP domain-containing protein (c-di-GMP phosphodiesterase class II)
MTTERPYHRALSCSEALAEVQAGRGTQFSPVVVDAFMFAAALLPDELGLDEPLQRTG